METILLAAIMTAQRRHSNVITRIRNTLYSPDRFVRISHFLFAQFLFALPDAVRLNLFRGETYYCPICQSHVSKFLILHRRYHAWCPICRSLQRHRLVWLYFMQHTDLFDPRPKRMLHLAPEPGIAARLRRLPQLAYVSADLNDPAAMVKLDICQIPYPAESFDVMYCSHVLEHVSDDDAALRELQRVLAPLGWVVILVPLADGPTLEETSVSTPMQRERLFGQHDHVRRYGQDFAQRLMRAGLKVRQVAATEIVDSSEIHRLGLSPDDVIFYCTK